MLFNLKRILKRVSIGKILALSTLIALNLPVLAIILRLNFAHDEGWAHYKNYILPEAVSNTILIVLLTGLATAILGTALAVVLTLYDFPLKGLFKRALYIPLAIPPYIAAYVFAGMLSYTGIFQKTARTLGLNVPTQWFDIMTLPGAVFIYTITLYPYIYGLVKSFLDHHSGSFLELSRTLGYSAIQRIFHVVLPLIRLPLAGGILLVAMETVSDYGVIRYFNVETISSVIFRSWFGMGETVVAIRMSGILLFSVLSFQIFDELMRGKKRYQLSGRGQSLKPIALKGFSAYLTCAALFIFIAIVFILPIGQMIAWSWFAMKKIDLRDIGTTISNTVILASSVTMAILTISVFLSHAKRWMKPRTIFVMNKLTQLGYGMPGAIIAIGTLICFVSLDDFLSPFYQLIHPNTQTLVLSTSILMLAFALMVRYLAVGYSNIQSGFAKIGLKFSDSARTLGNSKTRSLLTVELPLLKSSLISAFILTFIDIVKELPLTLLLRPFNFNSLASLAYEYASDERIQEASIPALMIVSMSLCAIYFLLKHKRQGV